MRGREGEGETYIVYTAVAGSPFRVYATQPVITGFTRELDNSLVPCVSPHFWVFDDPVWVTVLELVLCIKM